MKGCKNCPAFAKCTVTYRGSGCAALRSTYGVETDPEIITNADRIRAMDDKEISVFDYSGRSAHALKRVQRTGIAVQQSSAAVQPRPLGMG